MLRFLSFVLASFLSASFLCKGQASAQNLLDPHSAPPRAPSSLTPSIQQRPVDAATVRILALHGWEERQIYVPGRPPLRIAEPRVGHGSGLLIDASGLILTAKHVVDSSLLLMVLLPGQFEAMEAHVVYADDRHDLAFLRLNNFSQGLPAVAIPSSLPTLLAGQTILASGYPLDPTQRSPSVSSGAVSRLTNEGLLEMSTSLNPGNSGGPVTTVDGQLVGVAVQAADPRRGAQGLALLEPVSRVMEIMQEHGAAMIQDIFVPTSASTQFALQVFARLIVGAASDENSSTQATIERVLNDPQLLRTHAMAENIDPHARAFLAAIAWYRSQAVLADNAIWLPLAREILERVLNEEPTRNSPSYEAFRRVLSSGAGIAWGPVGTLQRRRTRDANRQAVWSSVFFSIGGQFMTRFGLPSSASWGGADSLGGPGLSFEVAQVFSIVDQPNVRFGMGWGVLANLAEMSSLRAVDSGVLPVYTLQRRWAGMGGLQLVSRFELGSPRTHFFLQANGVLQLGIDTLYRQDDTINLQGGPGYQISTGLGLRHMYFEAFVQNFHPTDGELVSAIGARLGFSF